MLRYTMFFVLVLALALSTSSSSAKLRNRRGLQMRVTDKGLQYGMEVAIKTFEEDMVGKPLPIKNSDSGSLKIDVKRALIDEAEIGDYSLTNIENVGLRAKVADIKIVVKADFSFVVKKWFFTVRDSLSVKATAKDAAFAMDLNIGWKSDGRPTMSGSNCAARVGSLDIEFSSSSRSWFYNAMESVFNSVITSEVNKMLCTMAIKEIRERGDKELESFPVKRIIDRYSGIDYSLTEAPKFTSDYMDVYLKGEIFSRRRGRQSSLRIPSFPVSSDASKMVYFWLTDYTLNTAGEVYHRSGALHYTWTIEEDEIPSLLLNQMKSVNTTGFLLAVPEIYLGIGLQISIKSTKAPRVNMEPGNVTINAFSEVTFRGIIGNATFEFFTLELDATLLGSVEVVNDFITGKIADFGYNIRLLRSNIGQFHVKFLEDPFVRDLIKKGILNQIEPALAKGIPLPTIEDIRFVNSDVEVKKDVVVIRADCEFLG